MGTRVDLNTNTNTNIIWKTRLYCGNPFITDCHRKVYLWFDQIMGALLTKMIELCILFGRGLRYKFLTDCHHRCRSSYYIGPGWPRERLSVPSCNERGTTQMPIWLDLGLLRSPRQNNIIRYDKSSLLFITILYTFKVQMRCKFGDGGSTAL